MRVKNQKNCRDCVYSFKLNAGFLVCEYLLRTDKMRPCPPGKDCTVKIKRKDGKDVYRA